MHIIIIFQNHKKTDALLSPSIQNLFDRKRSLNGKNAGYYGFQSEKNDFKNRLREEKEKKADEYCNIIYA